MFLMWKKKNGLEWIETLEVERMKFLIDWLILCQLLYRKKHCTIHPTELRSVATALHYHVCLSAKQQIDEYPAGTA